MSYEDPIFSSSFLNFNLVRLFYEWSIKIGKKKIFKKFAKNIFEASWQRILKHIWKVLSITIFSHTFLIIQKLLEILTVVDQSG